MAENKSTTVRIAGSTLCTIPGWVNWIAQDESGVWWGYSVEPLRNDRGWYENEVGDYIRLGKTDAGNWPSSLQKVNHA